VPTVDTSRADLTASAFVCGRLLSAGRIEAGKAMGLAVGMALGTMIGVLTGQLAIWISLGTCFGAALDAINKANNPGPPPPNARRVRRE